MKNKRITSFVVIVFVIAFSLAVYSFGEKIVQSVYEQKSENLLYNLNNELTVREEVYESDVVSRITTDVDIRKILKSKGYYEDDINISLKKYVDASVFYNITDMENKYIISLVTLGYDFEKVIDVYDFIQKTDGSISLLKQIYDLAYNDFESDFWIENAYAELVDENALRIEDVYYYINCGISIDEILDCYEISLKGKTDIGAMLDMRTKGKSWYDIAADTYELPKVESEYVRNNISISEIKSAADVARKIGAEISEVIDVSGAFRIKESALKSLTDKRHKIDDVCDEMKIVDIDDPTIIDAAVRNIPELERSEVEQLINEGYRIREIKTALESNTTNDSVMEAIIGVEGVEK